jgi:hypothetical protein
VARVPGAPGGTTATDTIYGSAGGGERVVTDDEFTAEQEYGWVFIASTANGVRIHDPVKVLTGAGPLLVLRDGSGFVLFPPVCDGRRALAAYPVVLTP